MSRNESHDRFFIFRPNQQIPDNLKLLKTTELVVSCKHKIGREAQEELKDRVRGIGGNALLNYCLTSCTDRIDNYVYTEFIASGKPALVVSTAYKGSHQKLIERYDDTILFEEERTLAQADEDRRRLWRRSFFVVLVMIALLFVYWHSQ